MVTMSSVFTMFFVFLFMVVIVPLSMAAERWLFQQTREVSDPEWALYQQRYD